MPRASDTGATSTHARLAWLLFAIFIVYGTVWPLRQTMEGRAWQSGHYSIPDVVQNVLLFVPFGALGMLALGPRRPSTARVAAITAIGCLFSVAIEAAQLFSIDRIASTADVVADTAGTLDGGLAAAPFATVMDRVIARVRWPMVIFALVSWFPFDVTLDVSTMSDRVRPLRIDPWQADAVTGLWWQATSAALLALAIAAHRRTRLRDVVIMSTATVIVVGLGRLAMGARAIGVAGALAQMVGGLLGAAVGALML